MRRILETLGSGLVVYLVMASCASDDRRSASTSFVDAGDTSPSSGGRTSVDGVAEAGTRLTEAGSATGGTKGGSIMDALVRPVPDAHAEEKPASGTRLKAKRIVGDDGSSQPPLVWFDSKRKEDCYWFSAEDGVTRCLPLPEATPASFQYLDPGCTQRVLPLLPNACPPKFVYEQVVNSVATCPRASVRYAFYSTGAQLPTATAYGKAPDGTCLDARNDPAVKLFPVTSIPPTEFVGSTVVVDD
jgi:hypothetical protein